MTPTDFNIKLDPSANESDKDLDSNNGIFSRVGQFFGGLFPKRVENEPVPLSSVALLDVQRYEPKGLVGLTMRVLRRRFFNLWARPPPSWTNAVSQGDRALPGTFVSRKRVRLPNTRLLDKSNNDSRPVVTRVGRLKNFVTSTVSSTSRRVSNLARGRLGDFPSTQDRERSYSDSERDKYMNKDRDSYSMQVNPSLQLGIFGRRRRDDHDYDTFLREEGEDANISPLRKLRKWLTEEMDSYISGPLDKLTLRIMKEDSDIMNPLARLTTWATNADSDKVDAINRVSNFLKTKKESGKGGWDISGYNDAAQNKKQINDLPVNMLRGVQWLVSSFMRPVRDPLALLSTPPAIPSSNRTISNNARGASSNTDGIVATISNGDSDNDKLGDIEPPWRWLVPNDYIAQSIIDMGNNVSSSFWSATKRDENSSDNLNGIDSLYRWIIPNDYIAQSFIDIGNNVSSSFWSSSFGRRGREYTDHDSFTRDEGNTDKDSILATISSINIAQFAFDIGSNLSSSVWSTLFGSSIKNDNVYDSFLRDVGDSDKDGTVSTTYSNGDGDSVGEIDPEISPQLTVVNTNRYIHGVSSFGGKTKDVMIYLVSGATRETFPVTSMIFRYAVAQPLEMLWSRGKERGTNEDSAVIMTKDFTAASMTKSANKIIHNSQLRQLFSATTRVVPILKLVRPLQRWSKVREVGDGTGADVKVMEQEKEKDSFNHVHVGDTERFYDLWKDGNESKKKSRTRDGGKVEGNESQKDIDSESDYSATFPFDEEAVSDSMKGRGQAVGFIRNALKGIMI